MAPPHVNTDLPRSLTAPGEGTVPAQSTTATSGSSSVPDRNAPKSTVTEPTSTYYGDQGNIGAKLAMDDLLALISREAKLTPRKEVNEQTSARQSEQQPNPVSAKSLIGPTEASHEKAMAETAAASQTSSWKTMFDGIGTTVGIGLVGVSKTQINKQLPPSWCMQCLACHPYPDTLGSYHIRPLRDNVAMHEAIRMGDLPPVDPWHDIVEALKVSHPQHPQHPQLPQPPQPQEPQEPRIRVTDFRPTEEEAKMLKQAMDEKDTVEERMKRLYELVGRKNEAIAHRNEGIAQRRNAAANSAQPLGLYTNAATAGRSVQPTGHPPKKRKAQAAGDDQQSGYADGNAPSKRRYPANVRGSASLNSTLSKMPQTDEAATAINEVATSEKSTQ
jgi:hypothetical protein